MVQGQMGSVVMHCTRGSKWKEENEERKREKRDGKRKETKWQTKLNSREKIMEALDKVKCRATREIDRDFISQWRELKQKIIKKKNK